MITPTHDIIAGPKTYTIGNNEDGGSLNFIRKITQTRKIIKEINPDIVHALYVFGPGVFAAFSGFHPFVLTAYGSDILIDPSSRFKRFFIQHALRKADVVTCDACHLKKSIIQFGVDDEKVDIVYFGTDVDKFNPDQKDNSIRKKLGLNKDPVVISLRSFKPLYDVETLIEAIPLVLETMPNTKFIIAGGGAQEVMLKRKAEGLGVTNSIRFVGLIPNDKIPYYLTASDVYVSTSLSDAGLAASTAEAMACSLPVVVTDFGENSEYVLDGENGLLISLKNPEALAESLLILLKCKSLRKTFGENGRRVIKERLDFDTEMCKIEKIYRELAE